MNVNTACSGLQVLEVIRRRRFVAVGVMVLAMAAGLVSQTVPGTGFQTTKRANRITQEMSARPNVTLAGTVHPQTRLATDMGGVNSNMQLDALTLNIALSPAQEADVNALLAAQQDPKSPQYHQWLTQEEYGARFGLTDADLNVVTSWLTGQGFTVRSVSKARNAIHFSGKVWQVETAFHTQMHRYQSNGETHVANTTNLQVPAAIGSVMLNVRGLHSFRPKAQAVKRVTPAYTAPTSQGLTHFLTPADWATIYNVKSIYTAGFDGLGAHVGVVGQTFAPLADITHFRSAAALGAAKVTYVCIDPTASNCTGTSAISTAGDLAEADLDIEWAGGIARNATVDYVYAPYSDVGKVVDPVTGSYYDVFDALQHAVQDYTIPGTNPKQPLPVISMSYTDCEASFVGQSAYVTLVTQIGQQATAQGQTIVVSSGDAGAAGCDSGTSAAGGGVWATVPVDSPYYTGVGGTTLSGDQGNPSIYWNGTFNLIDSALQYIPETVWNDTASNNSLSASGSGVSQYYALPFWQGGLVSGVTGRMTPDVAFASSANHDGYMACSQDDNSTTNGTSCATGFVSSKGFYNVYGGTSAAAPAFAGMLTLLTQRFGPQGNINPTLYDLAINSTFSNTVFHDVTGGDNMVPCTTGTKGCVSGTMGWKATSGYDLATGLGSINGGGLLAALGGTLATTTTSITVSPNSRTIGSGTVNLVATVSATAGTPGGTVIFKVGGVAQAPVTLSNGTATLNNVAVTVANGFGAGTDSIAANYGGDATFAASIGTTSLNVTGLGSTVEVLVLPPTGGMGDLTSFVANVSPNTATGSVNFQVGSKILGTVATLNGSAGLSSTLTTAKGFSVGANTITAIYSGDASYAASSGTAILTVTQPPSYTLTTSATAATISAGGSGAVTLNLASSNYAGTVKFVVGVSSAVISASAPSVLLTQNGPGSTLLTISPLASAANRAPAIPWKSGAVVFCAVLLGMPFTGRRKRAAAVLLTALAISLAGIVMACGGGGGSKAPKVARIYTVSVTPTGEGLVTNPAAVNIVVTVP